MPLTTLRLQIPGLSADATAPILGFDNLLVNGSLLYIEPARDALAAAPTAIGARLNNYARGSLARLTGAAVGELNASVIGNSFASDTGAVELTSAGALHAYVNNALSGSGSFEVDILPDALRDYILANPAHNYYVGSVLRRTAEAVEVASPNSIDPFLGIYKSGDFSGGGSWYMTGWEADSDDDDNTNTYVYPTAGYSTAIGVARGVLTLNAVAHSKAGRQVSNPGNWLEGDTIIGRAFWRQPRAPGGTLQGGTSFILYSLYVEDLTVSGRTYNEVNALRTAQVAADFAGGGRYDGETWTNPAGVSWA